MRLDPESLDVQSFPTTPLASTQVPADTGPAGPASICAECGGSQDCGGSGSPFVCPAQPGY
ncbi:MAG TPA: hypothetical protein VF746_11720 [Longimicrobium sp.]